MKKMLSIVVVGLMVSSAAALACGGCGCQAKKSACKKASACAQKADKKCAADCKKACCTKKAQKKCAVGCTKPCCAKKTK